jgi:hypothetical protein
MYSIEYIILIFFLNCVVLEQVPAVYYCLYSIGPPGSVPAGADPIPHPCKRQRK